MSCPRCGHVPAPEGTAACPACGAAPACPPPPPPTDDPVSRVRAEVDRRLGESELLDRVPGRSVSLAGVGLMALAIVLSLLPWFDGVGFFWSGVMLAGGAVVAVHELRAAGHPLPGARLPGRLLHPLVPPVFAGMVAVHAFHLLRVGVVPLLWLAAALLLGYDQYRKAVLSPEGFGRHFDLPHAWQGYRRYVIAGTGLCLVSLFFTWGETSGWLGGGYDYNYRYDSYSDGYGYRYEYNPAKYYYPGFEWSGRNQSLALFAEAALFALLLWAAYRPAEAPSRRATRLAAALATFLTLWWVTNLDSTLGVFVFFAGIAAVDYGLWKLLRAREPEPAPAPTAG